MFGGSSNWRGPIWVPVNALLIRGLLHYFAYYGNNFKIECPTGSGKLMNLLRSLARLPTGLPVSFCATTPVVGRCLAVPRNFSTTPVGVTTCCFTNIFTAIMVPVSGPVIRRGGRVWSAV